MGRPLNGSRALPGSRVTNGARRDDDADLARLTSGNCSGHQPGHLQLVSESMKKHSAAETTKLTDALPDSEPVDSTFDCGSPRSSDVAIEKIEVGAEARRRD